MKKFFYISIVLLLQISCGNSSTDVSKFAVHKWETEKIDFYLNKESNLLTETVVRQTFQNWGNNTHFTFVYKGRNSAGIKKDGKNTVSFLIKWPEGIPIDKIAWSQSWYDSKGNIVETDIIFNMLIANFTTLKTNKPNAYYVEGVLTHEIGHMIGLDHIENENSVMKQKSSLDESFFKGNIDELTLKEYRDLYSGM